MTDYTPSRELDARVAESLGNPHLSHAKAYNFPNLDGRGGRTIELRCPRGQLCGFGCVDGEDCNLKRVEELENPPPYTTAPTPDTMMQLIEHADSKLLSAEVAYSGGYRVRLTRKSDHSFGTGNADSLPAAVTEAYCKAYGLVGEGSK